MKSKAKSIRASWKNMKARCDQPNRDKYKYYGGRGITYDLRWRLFDNFYEDMEATWFPGATIDRINTDENYTKSNCRWATQTEQNRTGGRAKLSPALVETMRKEHAEGKTVYKIAQELDITWHCAKRAIFGDTWNGPAS